MLSSRLLINNEYIAHFVACIGYRYILFIQFGHAQRQSCVYKEIKSIVETLHKMQQALKLVTAKPHHLKN